MNVKKQPKALLQKSYHLLVPALILLACLWLWGNMAADPPVTVTSADGTWDLREIDFTRQSVRLTGAVEYIPHALLTPEAFAARQEEAWPVEHSTADRTMTTRLRLLVPEGWYTFTRVSIDFSHRLYVNGALVAEVGSPGDSAETDVPDTGRITFTAQPVDGVIELVQQSSNYVHRDGTAYSDWTVGGPAVGQNALAADYAANLEMGVYLCLFLIFLLLFHMLRSYRASLYFALFSLTWFVRTGVTGGKVFTVLLPWLGWQGKFRLEYLSLPAIVALTFLIIRALFPGVLHRTAVRIVLAVSGLAALLFLLADTLAMSRIMPVYQGVAVAAILYILARFACKLRRVRMEQGLFLTGMGLFFYAAVRDVLFYNKWHILPPFGDRELSQVAVLAFALFEATAVFLSTMGQVEEAKAAEQRLAAENAMLDEMNRMKSDLMQTISHEARTPLAVLGSYAWLVSNDLRQKGVEEQTAADLEKIAREARRVADLMDGLRQATSTMGKEPERIALDLGELARQTGSLYRPALESQGVALRLEIGENLPPVHGSPDQLSRVLFNLLQNARQHTTRGIISLTVAEEPEGVALTVADTGEGIPAELLPHVLERGVHGERGGSGLGLFLCKEVITAHGGTIHIESEPDRGTTVTVALPVWKEES